MECIVAQHKYSLFSVNQGLPPPEQCGSRGTLQDTAIMRSVKSLQTVVNFGACSTEHKSLLK